MESPYRERRPLKEIIPPDRRRQKAILLVVVSMAIGAGVLELGRRLVSRDGSEGPPPIVTNEGRLIPVMLTGPDGTMRVPAASGKTIVNVWLQGCSDCMPAFEAMREQGARELDRCGLKVINVAYGEGDPAWAGRYNVRTNLVYDRGGNAIVRPLAITSFTTLVLDENGAILHRDRPDRVGFGERMAMFCEEQANHPSPANPWGSKELDQAAVEEVVSVHRVALKRACWDAPSLASNDEAEVTVRAVVGTNGTVVETSSTGTDRDIARCVEGQVKTWTFPSPSERKVLSIPFKFSRK